MGESRSDSQIFYLLGRWWPAVMVRRRYGADDNVFYLHAKAVDSECYQTMKIVVV
jgi:hypothetical protein